MSYQQTSYCPNCGAPIWSLPPIITGATITFFGETAIPSSSSLEKEITELKAKIEEINSLLMKAIHSSEIEEKKLSPRKVLKG